MQTQVNNALYIKSRKADYVFQVKENQPNLLRSIESIFSHKAEDDWDDIQYDKAHGRVETRKIKCHSITSQDRKSIKFPYSFQVICIESTRYVVSKDKESKELRYYVTSLKREAKIINKIIRNHWHIENKLHYVKDVAFNEDHSQVRTGDSPRVMSSIRNLVMGIIRLLGLKNIKQSRRIFGWNIELVMALMT